MSRDDGFAVMDVSSDFVNDPKWRKLARHAPDHLGSAFVAYVAVLGESWKAGRRVGVDEAWPAFMAFSKAAVESLVHVHLLDSKGFIPAKTWRGWFDPARKRREDVRERWRRANAKRLAASTNDSAVTPDVPRGSSAATGANHSVPSVPSVPSVDTRDSPPPPTSGGRRKTKTNPRAVGTNPRTNGQAPRDIGTSPRQEREARKRGPTKLGQIMRQAAAGSDS